jgi:hypothetical protein
MSDRQPASLDSAVELHEINRQMELLMPRLAVATEACAEAAQPLEKMEELDSEQKEAVAARIRATEQEWEEVTQLLDQLLARARALGNRSPASPGEILS